MGNFFARLSYRFANFMQGRRGMDGLSGALVIVAVVLVLLAMIPFLNFLTIIGLIVLVIALVRAFSKNTAQREKEDATYERIVEKPRSQYEQTKRAFSNRKTTKYFKCPGCGATLSVPRGKGKLRVVCPKCQTETIKKS